MKINKKQIFFTFFILGLFFCLVIFEILLDLLGFGYDTNIFVKPKYLTNYYIDSTSFYKKFFKGEGTYIKKNLFTVQKKQGVLRGCVIGGSTVQGYPYYSNHSFTKMMEILLRESGRFQKVEILNLGLSAMTSYYVKDVALKLLSYQPDFIVIYAGHNEYYGIMGALDKGSHVLKTLALSLREYKSYQLLEKIYFGLFGDSGNSKLGTLMSKRFANKMLALNARYDNRVYNIFIRNLQDIIQKYKKYRIPVIVIEPISNLLDMPPFAGKQFKKHSLLMSLIKTYKKQEWDKSKKYLKQAGKDLLLQKDANFMYIKAKVNNISTKKNNLLSYIYAKDLDNIPFRARSILIEKMRIFYQSTRKKYPNFFYIPLRHVLFRKYGVQIFSHKIFIDHLHFNKDGNCIMAGIIANKIGSMFGFKKSEFYKLNKLANNHKELLKRIYLIPIYDVFAYSHVKSIMNDSPYKDMLLPYQIPSLYNIENKRKDPFRVKFLSILENVVNKYGNDISKINKYLFDYYLKHKKWKSAFTLLQSVQRILPCDSFPYYNLALFLEKLNHNFNFTFQYYIRAYLLSNKKKIIYNDLANYLKKKGKFKLLQQINDKYGKP